MFINFSKDEKNISLGCTRTLTEFSHRWLIRTKNNILEFLLNECAYKCLRTDLKNVMN